MLDPDLIQKRIAEAIPAAQAALQDLLKTGELHALALKTFTPEQWKTLRPPGL